MTELDTTMTRSDVTAPINKSDVYQKIIESLSKNGDLNRAMTTLDNDADEYRDDPLLLLEQTLQKFLPSVKENLKNHPTQDLFSTQIRDVKTINNLIEWLFHEYNEQNYVAEGWDASTKTVDDTKKQIVAEILLLMKVQEDLEPKKK